MNIFSSTPKKQYGSKSEQATVEFTPISKTEKLASILKNTRSRTNSIIDDLINSVEIKRKTSQSGIKKVGATNLQLLDSWRNQQYSFACIPWKETQSSQKTHKKTSKKNTTFIDKCLNIPEDESFEKDAKIQSLMMENAQLKKKLKKGQYGKIWEELNFLKKENEMLRRETVRLLKNS